MQRRTHKPCRNGQFRQCAPRGPKTKTGPGECRTPCLRTCNPVERTQRKLSIHDSSQYHALSAGAV